MTDTAPESLLDWMTGLVADPTARARFAADPAHEIDARGFAGLDPADVAHAMPLVTDGVAARFDVTVDLSTAPAQLAGESPLDALVRHFSSVPAVVEPAGDHELDEPDDWTESLLDDLAGAPDGLEGVVGNQPGVDLDLDGTGDLDGAHHDHDLDVMTRLDVDHDLGGAAVTVPAAAPTLALVPPVVGNAGSPPASPEAPGPLPDDEPGPAAHDDLVEEGHGPDLDDLHQHDQQPHDHPDDHGSDVHDLDVAP